MIRWDMGRWWYSGLALWYASLGSQVQILLCADYFSFFDITAEWPKAIQIAAILSSDGTNNVYIRSQHIFERT